MKGVSYETYCDYQLQRPGLRLVLGNGTHFPGHGNPLSQSLFHSSMSWAHGPRLSDFNDEEKRYRRRRCRQDQRPASRASGRIDGGPSYARRRRQVSFIFRTLQLVLPPEYRLQSGPGSSAGPGRLFPAPHPRSNHDRRGCYRGLCRLRETGRRLRSSPGCYREALKSGEAEKAFWSDVDEANCAAKVQVFPTVDPVRSGKEETLADIIPSPTTYPAFAS